MRPSDLIVNPAPFNGNVFSLIGEGGNYFELLCTNLQTAATPGDNYLRSISFTGPAENKIGIIGLTASYHKKGGGDTATFFLSVTNNNGKPEVHLENEWTPSVPAIIKHAQKTFCQYVVCLRVKEKLFTTEADIPGTYFLDDPNLIARFLAEDIAIDIDVLEENAKRVEAVNSAFKHLPELQKKINELEKEKAELTKRYLRIRDTLKKESICQKWGWKNRIVRFVVEDL